MRGIYVVVGGQHGDEAKGIEIQRLGRDADLVFRFGGGNNAGHTAAIYPDGKLTGLALHLLPSSVTWDKRIGIGAGVLLSPLALIQELLYVRSYGINPIPNLTVDLRCGTALIHHLVMDGVQEIIRGRNTGEKIGTTMSGQGPGHADIASRETIHLYDFLDPAQFEEQLKVQLEKAALLAQALGIAPDEWRDLFSQLTKNNCTRNKRILEEGVVTEADLDCTKFADHTPRVVGFNVEEMLKTYAEARTLFLEWKISGDVSQLIQQGLREGWYMLGEGSQGRGIDNLFGDGKYVTAGRVLSGAAGSGAGFGPTEIKGVRAVFKAVPSRVGGGPFATELPSNSPVVVAMQGDGTRIDDERGATTGRKRRIGYLDAVMGRTACQLNGADRVTLSKLDRVTPELAIIAVAYRINGQRYTVSPANPRLLEDPSLEVETVVCDHWTEDISGIRSWEELPMAAQRFVEKFEQTLNEDSARKIVVDRIGTGPGIDDVIIRC